MRVGINPEKQNTELNVKSYHRVVIPVYIPNLEEAYFKDGLKILKLCLRSLLHTIHPKTRISIINNGCCDNVVDYLKKIYQSEDKVDQLYHSKINLGKVNAIYAVVKSNLEPLITITDADVLFLPKWQTEVENVITDFPESGMVSPVPSSVGYRSPYLNSTVYYGLIKGRLKFENVLHPEGMKKFEESVGRKMYNKAHLKKYLTVSNSVSSAVIGCGHFVATMRAEVFKSGPKEVCQHKIVSGSETKYFDIPNDKAGFLRLATKGNYAYHLGNVYESWMDNEMEQIKKQPTNTETLNSISKANPHFKWQQFCGKILRIVVLKRFKNYYFKSKGISSSY
jgi:glycosyltransferase involved in cell wall biosynthesis